MKLNEPTAEGDYWELADDVNELYQQLSANKYRDIKSSQIQYVKSRLDVIGIDNRHSTMLIILLYNCIVVYICIQ